jgi:histidyl-tRNA synthetase
MGGPYNRLVPPAQPIKAARGVRDILPAERAGWELVEQSARKVATRFGYQEIVTPVIERAELVERGVGDETDIVQKEIYRVSSKADGGQQLVLRPEATAGVVRAYFEGGLNHASQPVRLFLVGPMFRHDRPQAGRYREFHQFDVEAVGDGSAALDAEVIEVALEWLAALGLGQVQTEINSIGDQSCRPAYLEELKAYYRPLKDRLGPDCQRRLETNPLRLLDCKEEECQPFKPGAPKITEHLCGPCAAAFGEVRRLLDAAGIEYTLNPYLVRGLDYYTRTVFELKHEALRDSVCGGGRYDGLARELGWPDTPAVGFAAGLERVLASMESEGENVVAPAPAELLVVPEGGALSVAASAVARAARAAVPTAVDYSDRSIKAKMRSANRLGVRWVALLNAAEADRQVVQLRDMASKEQFEVSWSELPERLA